MNAEDHVQRARLLIESNRSDLAVAAARQAIEDDVENAEAYALLALALHEQQKRLPTPDLREAESSIRTAIGLVPNSAYVWFVQSMIFKAGGKVDQARESIDNSLRLDPYNASYWNISACVYIQEGDLSMALKEIKQGLELDPEHMPLLSNKATCLIHLGRRDQGKEALESALRISPDDSHLHATRGIVGLKEENPGNALEHYRQALQLDPMNRMARDGLVESLRLHHPHCRFLRRISPQAQKFNSMAQLILMYVAMLTVPFFYGLFKPLPLLAPIVALAWAIFLVMSWTAGPLQGLILVLNRESAPLLKASQVVTTKVYMFFILASLLSVITAVFTQEWTWLGAAVSFLALMLPIKGAFATPPLSNRPGYRFFWLLQAGLLLAGLVCLLGWAPDRASTWFAALGIASVVFARFHLSCY